MKITYQKSDGIDLSTDALIVPVLARNVGDTFAGVAGALDEALDGELQKLADESEFKGKRGATLIVPTLGKSAARRIVLAGLGDEQGMNEEAIRRGHRAGVH